MRYLVVLLIMAVAFSASSETPNQLPATERERYFQFDWDNGAKYAVVRPHIFDEEHGPHKPSLLGELSTVIQFDLNAFSSNESNVDFDEHYQFRRVRFKTRGRFELGNPYEYKIQMGYEANKWVAHDLSLRALDLPYIRSIEYGYFKAPNTLSGTTGGGNLPMLERPAAVNAFWDNRRLGVAIGGNEMDQQLLWKFGGFSLGENHEESNFDSNNLKLIGRLSGIPIESEPSDSSKQLLHLGASFQIDQSLDNTQRFRARPESRLASNMVDTAEIDASNTFISGFESIFLQEAFSLQIEILQTYVSSDAESLIFGGGYATAGWLLTGDSQRYNKQQGCLDALIPDSNFSIEKGTIGAIEVFAHASVLDLSDKSVRGGRMTVFGTGLKWYFNQRWQLHTEALRANVTESETPGNLWIFQSRIQFAL